MKVKVAQSCLTLCDPMNCSRQAPLSMEFSRPDYYQKTSPCHLAILILAYTATDLLSMFSGVLILGKLLNGRAAFLHCYNGEGTSTSQVLRVSVLVTQSCQTLCNHMDYTVHGILQARILEWVAFPSPGDLPNPGIEPRFPTLQADSLPAEPQGKPKNTGAGSLSLLQWIFQTQELNWDLQNCRWILYQLSYQGSPDEAN